MAVSTDPAGADGELSFDELQDAAAADLRVLAIIMVIGALGTAVVSMAIGAIGWIGAALTVATSAAYAWGLWNRSAHAGSVMHLSYRLALIGLPIAALLGLAIALLGDRWGWAMMIGSIVGLGISMLGLAIVGRAWDYEVFEN